LTFLPVRIKKVINIKHPKKIITVKTKGVPMGGASMIEENKIRPDCPIKRLQAFLF
jgi:hypothetical protein